MPKYTPGGVFEISREVYIYIYHDIDITAGI